MIMISCENVCPSYFIIEFYDQVTDEFLLTAQVYSSRAETLRGPSDSYISCSPRQTNALQ